MKTSQKCGSLVCALILVGAIALPTDAAISFSSSKPVKPKTVEVTRYLGNNNVALRRALNIHNLLNEMPGLRDIAQTNEDLGKQRDIFGKQLEAMQDCHAKKLGDVFKNPSKAWSKMMNAYEGQRQASSEGKNGQQPVVKDQEARLSDAKKNMNISRNIMVDVYKNPAKWGEVKDGGSFPLWKDQVVVFEKQWNDFYNQMNKEFGAPLSGRPQVDEKTRQNPQKYNDVLRAHNVYLTSLQKKKNMNYKDLPPKAPAPLPDWKEMVMIDPSTNQAYPELPTLWKDSKTRDMLIRSNPQGELAQAFVNGDVSNPSNAASLQVQSSMEQEYNARLGKDSLDKGFLSVQGSMSDLEKGFAKKLENVGIQVEKFDLSNRGQYFEIQKQLREEKKKAISDAQKYIRLLEKQEQEHPELVARRQSVQAKKQAKLSEKAQKALSQTEDIVQISQMSPVMQQKMVVAALEKDENALVHLTETNALKVDQMMRERQSTNKIIAESQKQMQSVYDKQLGELPQFSKCPF